MYLAGYNINRRLFFKYLSYILIFAIGGTILAFCIIAPLTFLANKGKLFRYTITTHASANSTTNATSAIPPKPSHRVRKLDLGLDEEVIIKHNYISVLDKSIYNQNFNSRYLSLEKLEESEVEKVVVEKVADKVAKPDQEEDSSIINFSVDEILLFSAVISATDTVAALTFVSETEETKLYSILFGEGVVNDAVCIVLYSIVQNFVKSKKG